MLKILDEDQLPSRFRGDFTYRIANTILNRLLKGESLRKACDRKDIPVSYRTAYQWLALGRIPPGDVTDKNKHLFQFRKAYLHAKSSQAEDIYEEMQEIEGQIKTGEISPQQGSAILGSLRYRIAHMDFGRYGDKKRIEGETKVIHRVEIGRELIEGPKKVVPLIA